MGRNYIFTLYLYRPTLNDKVKASKINRRSKTWPLYLFVQEVVVEQTLAWDFRLEQVC